MVFVGGYTRLSGSGLSITEWKPIHGVIPPLSMAEWEEEFTAYRASPQYLKINKGMSLDEFKTIFWPEFWHRILGRIIGAVFIVPLLFFAIRRSISKRFGLRLTGIFALGGLQGFIGWFMVASGLIDNPHVSHLRLALHLSLAFLIFALILWALLDIHNKSPKAPHTTKHSLYKGWFVLLCTQIIIGAFVAGQHAGLIYNTWPTMNGQWLPSELWSGETWHENLALIQFIHRKIAIFLAVSFIFWWFLYSAYVKNNHLGKAVLGIGFTLFLQFALGVATLLWQVPLWLALAHQMTALLLFAFAVNLLHKLSRSKAQ